MSYIVVPLFDSPADEAQPDNPPTGSPGKYTITYVLAVPGRLAVQDEVNFAELVQKGDSLLEVGAEVHELRVPWTTTLAASSQRSFMSTSLTACVMSSLRFRQTASLKRRQSGMTSWPRC
jgi:hypothetical protein